MANQNFGGLILPAMAALSLRGKRTNERGGQSSKVSTVPVNDATISSVDKYLQHQKELETTSGVSKYLENLDKNPASGVTKYLRRQAVAEKMQAAQQTPVSGVEKYLKNRKAPQALSGVAKYIKKIEQSPLSSVSKYLAKQAVAAQKSTASNVRTSVAKYVESQSQYETTRVAKYLARLAIAEKQALAAKQATAKVETGVEKYLRLKNI